MFLTGAILIAIFTIIMATNIPGYLVGFLFAGILGVVAYLIFGVVWMSKREGE